MNNPIELNLRHNAYDFLNESIRNAERAINNPAIWKFAIINLAQAIELLLKERLRQEHQLLVYIDVDRRRQTVGVDQALARLDSCGISFEQEDIVRLRRARDIRNNIVHYDIAFNPDQFHQSYIDLFEFIHVFHIESFGEEIHSCIEDDLWVTEAKLMEEFRREFVQYQGATVTRTFPSEILDSQFILYYYIDGQAYRRIRWQKYPESPFPDCRDCSVLPGQLHTPGCHNERCPRCKGQWISCPCTDDADVQYGYVEEIDEWIVDSARDDIQPTTDKDESTPETQ